MRRTYFRYEIVDVPHVFIIFRSEGDIALE
jgi:hypothetical protein